MSEGLFERFKRASIFPFCANCYVAADATAAVELKLCAGCRAFKYCSDACQRADWPAHRSECRRIRERGLEAWHREHFNECLSASAALSALLPTNQRAVTTTVEQFILVASAGGEVARSQAQQVIRIRRQ